MNQGILIVMARAPRFGAVKTRLARDVGALKAWRFYRNTLQATVNRLRRGMLWRTVLQVTPDRDRRNQRQWPRTDAIFSQGHGDLGRRMERGLTSFRRGTPVVLIGSDIPDVTTRHIREAFNALGHSDVVFGPATDGGYWLVGFANRQPIRKPFQNVRWSTQHALKDTCENFKHRRITLIDELSDVDEGASYKKTKAR